MRVLTELRAKHAEGKSSWGINGDTGTIVDMKEYGIWEPEAIKLQSIKTAIEVSFLLPVTLTWRREQYTDMESRLLVSC